MVLERQHLRENKSIRQPTGPHRGPENIRLLASTFPTQNIKHGEVESPSEIKGVNCLETTILKYSLRSCPHRRNNCKLIKEDQGWELHSRPCGGEGVPVLLLPWGPSVQGMALDMEFCHLEPHFLPRRNRTPRQAADTVNPPEET